MSTWRVLLVKSTIINNYNKLNIIQVIVFRIIPIAALDIITVAHVVYE